MKRILTIIGCLCLLASCRQEGGPVSMMMETTMGNIEFRLYDETPLHRDNFIKLAQEHYFDSLLFHRVIEDFMIQGGDPNSKNAEPGQFLGDGEPDYRVPAEFRLEDGIYNKRGTIGAAREGNDVNPEMESCASQFYFVWGKIFDDEGLDKTQERLDRETGGKVKLTPEMREYYKTYGGTPHLDGQYTIFGEITEGLDVVEAIQKVETDENDRPLTDVRIMKVYQKPEGQPYVKRSKVINDGGDGPYPAIAVEEKDFPGFVIYRPQNVKAAARAEKSPLPVMVFANGGCNDTSLPHENLLNSIASHGYIVIALGQMQFDIRDRRLEKSPNEDMIKAMDWITAQNADKNSLYYKSVKTDGFALGGQSCGGAQVLVNCGDPRVQTCLMFNSGIADMEMSGASRQSLEQLHGSILYLVGGDTDQAYRNALVDYDNISAVPVALANQLCAGHVGSFAEPFGGSFGKMALKWLDWQFKGKAGKEVFLENSLDEFPDWTMKSKNFPGVEDNEPFVAKEVHCTSRDGKDIWGIAYIPNTPDEKKPTVIMAHGFNGTFDETKPYAECLAMRGVASYIFEFCGGGNRSHSEGKTTDMTIFTEKENIEDIYREVSSWDYVDKDRMALLGCSQGGLVAAVTAAANPSLFKDLILVYPALNIPNTASRMLATPWKEKEFMGLLLGRNYYESINGMDVLGTIGNYKGNVFFVYGDADPVVGGGMMDKAQAAYAHSSYKVVPTGKHGFPDYRNHQQATAGIIDFVMNNL